MTEPRRPDPGRSFVRGFTARFVAARGKLIESGRALHRSHNQPVVLIVITAIGSAAFALGSLWAWQAWSGRSSEPVDARLPLLVGEAGDPDEASGTRSVASPDEASDTEANVIDSDVPRADVVEAALMSPAAPQTVDPEQAEAQMIVHVSGDVARPGVVSLQADARVHDAVEAAGGANDSADLDRVNLAAPVVDGERIHVPAVGEDEPVLVPSVRPAPATNANSAGATPTAIVVDLNRAGQSELEALPGVGPATAIAIVETRDQRGPFLSVDELLEVDGIGPAKLEQLRAHVRVQSR